MSGNGFKAVKVSKTATFEVEGNIDDVFPLFGAFEERKWADGWNPKLIYPQTETIEEGTTFSTPGHGPELEYLWRVSRFEPKTHLIHYLVSTENRYWIIAVQASFVTDNKTSMKVTYSYYGLNETGNKINKQSIEKMYSKELKDWQAAINYYLLTGKTLKEV